eukprot:1928986-Rhodomonas_salina.1
MRPTSTPPPSLTASSSSCPGGVSTTSSLTATTDLETAADSRPAVLCTSCETWAASRVPAVLDTAEASELLAGRTVTSTSTASSLRRRSSELADTRIWSAESPKNSAKLAFRAALMASVRLDTSREKVTVTAVPASIVNVPELVGLVRPSIWHATATTMELSVKTALIVCSWPASAQSGVPEPSIAMPM